MVINLYPFNKWDAHKKKALVKDLQNSMCAHFLEHTMYSINDALTSILALCDIEEMKTVPKVKKYIQRVNELMNNVQVYQAADYFNANHVLKNVIDIIKDNFKRKVDIKFNHSQINALVKSNQIVLEQILLYIFVELVTAEKEGSASLIDIDLHQKDTDVVIYIRKENYSFSTQTLKELDEMKLALSGSLSIRPKENGIEIYIKLPLDFRRPQASTDISVGIIPKQKVESEKKEDVAIISHQ